MGNTIAAIFDWGSPDVLRQMANRVDWLEREARSFSGIADSAVRNLGTQWTGDASRKFQDFWTTDQGKECGTAPRDAFEALVAGLEKWASGLRTYADKLEHSQNEHDVALAITAALLILDVVQLGLDPVTDAATAVELGVDAGVDLASSSVISVAATVGGTALRGLLQGFVIDLVSQIGANVLDDQDPNYVRSHGADDVLNIDGHELLLSSLTGAVSGGLAGRNPGLARDLVANAGGQAITSTTDQFARYGTVDFNEVAVESATSAGGAALVRGVHGAARLGSEGDGVHLPDKLSEGAISDDLRAAQDRIAAHEQTSLASLDAELNRTMAEWDATREAQLQQDRGPAEAKAQVAVQQEIATVTRGEITKLKTQVDQEVSTFNQATDVRLQDTEASLTREFAGRPDDLAEALQGARDKASGEKDDFRQQMDTYSRAEEQKIRAEARADAAPRVRDDMAIWEAEQRYKIDHDERPKAYDSALKDQAERRGAVADEARVARDAAEQQAQTRTAALERVINDQAAEAIIRNTVEHDQSDSTMPEARDLRESAELKAQEQLRDEVGRANKLPPEERLPAIESAAERYRQEHELIRDLGGRLAASDESQATLARKTFLERLAELAKAESWADEAIDGTTAPGQDVVHEAKESLEPITGEKPSCSPDIDRVVRDVVADIDNPPPPPTGPAAAPATPPPPARSRSSRRG